MVDSGVDSKNEIDGRGRRGTTGSAPFLGKGPVVLEQVLVRQAVLPAPGPHPMTVLPSDFPKVTWMMPLNASSRLSDMVNCRKTFASIYYAALEIVDMSA
jgi:hypothetical protein